MFKYFSIVLMSAFAAPAFASDAVVQPSIAVMGFAEAKITPDQATLNVEVYTEKRDLQAAKKEQDEKVKKLVAIAKKQGIKEEQIRTLYANVNPIYDYLPNTNKPKFRAYGLSNNIQVVTNDLTLTGPLMDALVEAGYDRIQGVQFGLKDQRGEQDKLMKLALLNAKTKASNMVNALDAKLGKPITITESGSYNPPPVMMAKSMRAEMAVADASAGSMPTYTPVGLIEIQQTVNVTFAMD